MSRINSDFYRNDNLKLDSKLRTINQALGVRYDFRSIGEKNKVELLRDGKPYRTFTNRANLVLFLNGMFEAISVQVLKS